VARCLGFAGRAAGRRARDRHTVVGRGHVQTLGGVDPALDDRTRTQLAKVVRVAQHETRLPERMVEPRAAQFMQVHAHADVVDSDLLEHVASVSARVGVT